MKSVINTFGQCLPFYSRYVYNITENGRGSRFSCMVMSVLLNAPKIRKNRKKYMNNNENEEEYNMCQALQEWIEEEHNMGMEKCSHGK